MNGTLGAKNTVDERRKLLLQFTLVKLRVAAKSHGVVPGVVMSVWMLTLRSVLPSDVQ